MLEATAIVAAQDRLQLVERPSRGSQPPGFGRITAQGRDLRGGRHNGRGGHGRPQGWSLGEPVHRLFAHGDVHARGPIPVEQAKHFVVI